MVVLFVYLASQATWLAWGYLAVGAWRAVIELVAARGISSRTVTGQHAVEPTPLGRVWRDVLRVTSAIATQIAWPACELEQSRWLDLARRARHELQASGAPSAQPQPGAQADALARVHLDELECAAVRTGVVAVLLVPTLHASNAPHVLAVAFAVAMAVDHAVHAVSPIGLFARWSRPRRSFARLALELALQLAGVVLAFAAWQHADGAPLSPDLVASALRELGVASFAAAARGEATAQQVVALISVVGFAVAAVRQLVNVRSTASLVRSPT